MTGGKSPRISGKSAKSAKSSKSSAELKIRYEVKSDDNEEFIMTYYGPVNKKQQPHGMGQLYVGPTLQQMETFKGKFKNGVVNDDNGKTPIFFMTLFGWGYANASIMNGNIIDSGNNENLNELKKKNIILNFNKMTKRWAYDY